MDEVTDAQGLPNKTEYLFFNGPVSHCKSIVLALVFHPRIDEEGFDTDPWGFGCENSKIEVVCVYTICDLA
jgi:hypothetical protein